MRGSVPRVHHGHPIYWTSFIVGILKGEKQSTEALRTRVREHGDDSFCSTLRMSETDLPVLPEGWRYDLSSLTVLRVKGNVDPHTDSYVGGVEDVKEERSIFWLLGDRSKKPSWLLAGTEAIRMKPNEWAFFDHQETHAFMASATWIGISVQVYQ